MTILVILMIIMTKMTKKTYNYCEVWVKKCYFKDYYLVKKRGQKIRAWVDPPPLFRAMPDRKRFFLLMSSLRRGAFSEIKISESESETLQKFAKVSRPRPKPELLNILGNFWRDFLQIFFSFHLFFSFSVFLLLQKIRCSPSPNIFLFFLSVFLLLLLNAY